MAWIYQRNDSKQWWIGYRLNGRQFLRSLKTEDRKQAERELEKIKAADHAHRAGSLTDEFVSLLTKRPGTGDTLVGYVKQWLVECRDLSSVTVDAYRDTLREFCEYLAANDKAPLLRDIQRAAIGSYLRAKRTDTDMLKELAKEREREPLDSFEPDKIGSVLTNLSKKGIVNLSRAQDLSARSGFVNRPLMAWQRKAKKLGIECRRPGRPKKLN